MVNKEEKEKILDKIQKMFALGTSPNEHEAQRAIRMAHELMAKYNISEKEFEDDTKQKTYVDIELKIDEKMRKWHKQLAAVIAKYFMVTPVICGDLENKKGQLKRFFYFRVFGTEVNVELYKQTYIYLMRVFKRLVKEFSAKLLREAKAARNNMEEIPEEAMEALENIMNVGMGMSKKNIKLKKKSYILGLIAGMNQALIQQVQKEKEMGLVLVKDPGVDQYMREQMGHVRDSHTRQSRIHPDSYHKGVRDGRNVQLNNGDQREGVTRLITGG